MKKSSSARLKAKQELCRRNLQFFTKSFWHVVDKHQFKSNWHIECIAEHLIAVKKREIKRLIINIPPRHMKSLSCSVFFPTWLWLDEPSTQFLCASYAQTLSTRDCQKSRRIIQTPEYQALIPVNRETNKKSWELRKDQNQKMRYENTETGHRIATSVDGALTGDGGDIIIIDDPHNVREAESDAVRKACVEWWDEAMSTRLNDINTGVYIIIQQRVHEGDLTGHILAKNNDYEHLCLPARYEGFNRIKTSLKGDWRDPRKKEGDPLWEGHLDDNALRQIESGMTEYAIAGQLQQRPAPREGGMFKLKNFPIVHFVNRDDIMASVRYWDKAGTQDGGCYTAGVLLHKMKDKSYIIEHVEHGQWSAHKRERIIKKNCEADNIKFGKRRFSTYIEQEPGSSGKETVEETVRNLAPFKVHADRVTGDKITRAEGYAAQVEIKNVSLLKGDWNKDFLKEHKNFPRGKFKDQVDSASGAFHKLSAKKKRAGALISSRERSKQRVIRTRPARRV